MLTIEQKELVNNFYNETKKMFKSCKYACVNVGENVWGDFTSKKQAIAALFAWSRAFKGTPNIRIEGKAFRVTVTF